MPLPNSLCQFSPESKLKESCENCKQVTAIYNEFVKEMLSLTKVFGSWTIVYEMNSSTFPFVILQLIHVSLPVAPRVNGKSVLSS